MRKYRFGTVKFTNSDKLLEYLKTDENGAYMWSDSEDLTVIADMYQIRIKVVTTKGNNDKNPTVNWIHPEKNLEQHAELKDVQLDDMVLLH